MVQTSCKDVPAVVAGLDPGPFVQGDKMLVACRGAEWTRFSRRAGRVANESCSRRVRLASCFGIVVVVEDHLLDSSCSMNPTLTSDENQTIDSPCSVTTCPLSTCGKVRGISCLMRDTSTASKTTQTRPDDDKTHPNNNKNNAKRSISIKKRTTSNVWEIDLGTTLTASDRKWCEKLRTKKELPEVDEDWAFVCTYSQGWGWILRKVDWTLGCNNLVAEKHVGAFRFDGTRIVSMDIVKALVKTCHQHRPRSVSFFAHKKMEALLLQTILTDLWGMESVNILSTSTITAPRMPPELAQVDAVTS